MCGYSGHYINSQTQNVSRNYLQTLHPAEKTYLDIEPLSIFSVLHNPT